MPLTVDGMGEVKILVPSTAAGRAAELVASYLEQTDSDPGDSPPDGGRGLD